MQLHKRDVVEAATTLLDDYGIADLTMRRLARELNVSPGALYWHFANKQQLLGAVADRILDGRRRARAAGVTDRRDLRSAARRAAVAHRRRRAGVGQLRGRTVGGDGADSGAADRRGGRRRRRLQPTPSWPPARSSTTCSASPSTSSRGCSGTRRAPSCPSGSRCSPRTRTRGSRSACACSSTASTSRTAIYE